MREKYPPTVYYDCLSLPFSPWGHSLNIWSQLEAVEPIGGRARLAEVGEESQVFKSHSLLLVPSHSVSWSTVMWTASSSHGLDQHLFPA